MAKRRPDNDPAPLPATQEAAPPPVVPPSAPAAPEPEPAPAPSPPEPHRHHGISPNLVRLIIILVFAIAEGITVFLFVGTGGDTRVQGQQLDRVSKLEKRGQHSEAIRELEDFGKKWPGALKTAPYNKRLANLYALSGNQEEAAKNYLRAVLCDRELRGLRADAGEALFKTGDLEKAAILFNSELQEGDPNSDKANYYLGQLELKKGDVIKAFAYFQALKDPSPWSNQIAQARQRLETEVMEAARSKVSAGS